MKIPIRGTKNKQKVCMWPSGRQFDMPVLHYQPNSIGINSALYSFYINFEKH